jgi:hypothetical protein
MILLLVVQTRKRDADDNSDFKQVEITPVPVVEFILVPVGKILWIGLLNSQRSP